MGFLWKRFSGMTWGGIAGFLAVLLVAGAALFMAGARWVNTTPEQCATCHPQLTEMWKRSQGHPASKVTCQQCHAQQLQGPVGPDLASRVRDGLIPEKYLATDARLLARCESCHADMRTAEKEKKQIIRVNHKVHLAPLSDLQGRKVQLNCLSCHRNVAHDKAQVETNRPRMAGCFTGTCHQADRNKDNCRRCHYQQLVEPGQEPQPVL